MLVEFSSWETADTSLRLTVSKRKRRRGGSNGSATPSKTTKSAVTTTTTTSQDAPLLLAASVVIHRSGRRKKKRAESATDSRALFALTSPHRVTVMAEKNHSALSASTTPVGAPPSEALEAACYMHESSNLQYTSRPGPATSFVSSSTGRQIPVILDAKQEYLFGLQGNNERLVVWKADQEGPDDAHPGLHHVFSEQADSLSLLPNGMVLGSTESGQLFVASVVVDMDAKDDNSNEHGGNSCSLQVKYLNQENEAPTNAQHVGFLVKVVVTGGAKDDAEEGSRKRKSKGGSQKKETLAVHIFQSFVQKEQGKCILRRHEVLLPSNNEAASSLQIQKSTEASVALFSFSAGDDGEIQDATILPTMVASPDTFTLTYRLKSCKKESQQCCATIQLNTATLVHPPFVIDCPRPQQRLVLISPRILVMGMENELQIRDAFSGILLRSEPLPPMMLNDMDCGDNWTLLADARRGQLLVLCCDQDGMLHITTTTLKLENDYEGSTTSSSHSKSLLKTSDIPLAARLAAALGESSSGVTTVVTPRPMQLILLEKDDDDNDDDTHIKAEGDMEAAMAVLHTMESSIKEKEGRGYKDGSLVTAYEQAVDSLLQAATKPKEPAEEPKNGVKRKAVTPVSSKELPVAFVDAVFPGVLHLLLHVSSFSNLSAGMKSSIQQDCMVVLELLLETGKVLARLHFDQSAGAENTLMALLCCLGGKQTEKNRLRSPTDFIFKMLRHCPDVSESMMVTMIHFMLCSSRPVDIAFSMLDSRDIPKDHCHKTLSRRYLDEESTATACKLVMAGSAAVLEKILMYSYCNQALLCSAFREQLTFGEETGLFSRLISEVAFSHSNLTMSILSNPLYGRSLVSSAAQWIPAFLDAFGDEMKEADDDDGNNEKQGDVERLLKSLDMARRQTEVLIGLEDRINDSILTLSGKWGDQGSQQTKRQKFRADEESLPSYSVERLVL